MIKNNKTKIGKHIIKLPTTTHNTLNKSLRVNRVTKITRIQSNKISVKKIDAKINYKDGQGSSTPYDQRQEQIEQYNCSEVARRRRPPPSDFFETIKKKDMSFRALKRKSGQSYEGRRVGSERG